MFYIHRQFFYGGSTKIDRVVPWKMLRRCGSKCMQMLHLSNEEKDAELLMGPPAYGQAILYGSWKWWKWWSEWLNNIRTFYFQHKSVKREKKKKKRSKNIHQLLHSSTFEVWFRKLHFSTAPWAPTRSGGRPGRGRPCSHRPGHSWWHKTTKNVGVETVVKHLIKKLTQF